MIKRLMCNSRSPQEEENHHHKDMGKAAQSCRTVFSRSADAIDHTSIGESTRIFRRHSINQECLHRGRANGFES